MTKEVRSSRFAELDQIKRVDSTESVRRASELGVHQEKLLTLLDSKVSRLEKRM